MNGVGPKWFPDWFRALLTKAFTRWFPSLPWAAHDVNYAQGGSEFDRWGDDLSLFSHMRADATNFVPHTVAIVTYIAVALFGWISFNYN